LTLRKLNREKEKEEREEGEMKEEGRKGRNESNAGTYRPSLFSLHNPAVLELLNCPSSTSRVFSAHRSPLHTFGSKEQREMNELSGRRGEARTQGKEREGPKGPYFGVCSNDHSAGAQVALHGELVNARREIHADVLLLGIVTDAFTDVISAGVAPHVEGHLETEDERRGEGRKELKLRREKRRRRRREVAYRMTRMPSVLSFLARSRSGCWPTYPLTEPWKDESTMNEQMKEKEGRAKDIRGHEDRNLAAHTC
jgi:hypothetical protein